MRIAILGAGAIGGVTAAFLAKGGQDVTLVCHRPETAALIREKGLHITGKRGEHFVKLPAVADVAELSGSFDAVLLVTKAYDLPHAAASILPYLAPQGLAVCLQNGVCIDTLANIVGRERAAAAVVTWSSTMRGEAELEITGKGAFVLGRMDGRIDESLTALKTALDCMAPTRVSENILAELYAKLIINSAITCGGAMTGQTLGQMLVASAARRFFIAIVREDMAVAEAMGIQVPSFGGKLDYYRFLCGRGIFADLRRHGTLFALGLKYRKLTSSSLTALRRGRKTEAPYLNGWISRQGREHNVLTPVNDRVVDLVTQIEEGKRSIDPKNIMHILYGEV